MELNAINSSASRVNAPQAIGSPPTAAPEATDPARPAAGGVGAEAPSAPAGRPEVQGVPRRIGVQQQLPPNTRFRIDEESNRVVAQILDENNEVVRQIPPEALLKLSTRISRLEGLLFNRES